MKARLVSPTERGQVTIPKEFRERLRITPRTRLRIFIQDGRVILEPVSPFDLLVEELESEARTKGLTREELEREIEETRARLVAELYGE
ncbi:MAG: AbrB/MazE/SpoVT family DNA-binding domain-containing protein [Bacillota bacterium]|nr:AbrB/MazE/SpoVT family DNA-binding domain-containing protein [Bacillota bacterium]